MGLEVEHILVFDIRIEEHCVHISTPNTNDLISELLWLICTQCNIRTTVERINTHKVEFLAIQTAQI